MKHPKYLTEVDSRECNRQTTPGTRRVLSFLAAALCLSAAWQASAASGTWTNLTSSIWGDPTNWLNAVVADGNGATADFSTINPTADVTVSLELTRTNTNLIFGDADPGGSPASWILDNGGNAGNLLELAGATPTITVNQLGANNERTATISAVIDGTNGLTKAGGGLLNLTAANTYTNGTTVNGGIIVMSSTATTLGSNIISNPLTFNGGAISNNWGAGNSININNSIVLPTGQTGTIYMGNRLRLASSGNAATITGGGTLNLVCNTTVSRDDIGSVAGAFTGTVNYVGSGGVRHFINAGAFVGYSNATVNFNGALDIQFNDNSGGNTFAYGAIAGTNSAVQIGNTSAGGAPRLVTGLLNTDASFAGRFVNTAQIIKNGTGAWTFLTPTNHTHTGSNVVGAGKWVLPTGATFSNAVSLLVSNGATLGIQAIPGFTRFVSCPLTNQAGSTIEFNLAGSVPSTTVAPLLVNGNFSPSTSTTLSIKGGIWSTGVFPLIKYTNLLGGNGFPALALGTQPARVQGYLSNDVAATSIDYVVTNTTQPLRWAGGSGTWDTTSTFIWQDSGGTFVAYQESGGIGDSVVFGDNPAGSPVTVTLNSVLSPIGITANATNKNYTISGTGGIAGLGSITKSGPGTLTLSTANSFSGGVNLNGGIINFSTLNNLGASSSPLVFGGGTLQWASGNTTDISVRTVRFNAGDGTLDTGGNNVTFASPVGSGGAGGLTKTGAGTLTLSGANNYSGTTTVNQGTLALATGATIANSGSIVVNSGAIFDAGSSGITLSAASSQSLSGGGTVNGAVTCPASTFLKPGTSPGTLTLNNDLVLNGGTYVYDVSTNSGRDLIVVGGNLTLTLGTVQVNATQNLTNGVYKLIQYSGSLSGSAANLVLSGFAQLGKLGTLSDSTPGEIDLVVSTAGGSTITWQGDGSGNLWDVSTSYNWLNGITATQYANGDFVTFNNSGSTAPPVNLTSALQPSNITVNASADYTFSTTGAGRISGVNGMTKSGSGKLTLLVQNNNAGATTISGGTLQVGDGVTTGDIGTGNITNNGALVFAQTDNRIVAGTISGSGSVVQQGSATLTYTKDNTYSGPTTIASGTLQVGNGGATGALGSGPVTNSANLVFNRSGPFTVANGIKGSGTPNPASLTKIGTATLTLAGINTYEGNTSISNGVLKLGASEVIPDGGTTTGWLILDGGATNAGTLDMNGFNETVNNISGLGGAVLGQIINSAASGTNTLTFGDDVNANTYAGNINDAAGAKVLLRKLGAAGFTLSSANGNWSGGAIVGGGSLTIRNTQIAAGAGTLILSNGTTLALVAIGANSTPNPIFTPAGATATLTADNLASGHSGAFSSGDATSTNLIAGAMSIGAAATKQFQGFTGVVDIQAGFQLRYSSTALSVNGGDNTSFIVESAATLNTRNGNGNGEGIAVGALFGSGTLSGASGTGNTGTTRFNIGARNTDCEFSGTITGTGTTTVNIAKVGSGRLVLDGTLSYDGATVVSNGVLQIASTNNSSTVLDTTTNIVIRANAVLDVSERSDSTLSLNNNQNLTGSGTIRGSVNVVGASTIAPGDAIGTLTVTNAVTLGSLVTMELNRTNVGATNDMIACASVTAGGTLTVTNLGPDLITGDTFKLFSVPVSGSFTTVNLPTTFSSGTYVWTNKLAIDGTIKVLSGASPINPNPPTITASVSGNNVNLSWQADRTGWTLQTNAGGVLSGNWFAYPGSTTTNSVSIPIDHSRSNVFFRMTLQ